MRVSLLVENTDQANVVRTAWQDPAVRAFVIVLGTLMQLPSDRSRARVLNYVNDIINEEAEHRRVTE